MRDTAHPSILGTLLLAWGLLAGLPASAQTGPNASEVATYQGLHAAAQHGDLAQLDKLVASRGDLNVRDGHGRTPIHVATFARQRGVLRALAKAGADLNLLEADRYDGVTIASVANDEETLRLLLSLGASAPTSSPSPGTSARSRSPVACPSSAQNWRTVLSIR